MTNSGAPGGLPMTHRAGGEFHGPLGHASSDLSEIASRKQNFWGISRPSGCVSGISRALSRPRSHRKRSDKGSQRSDKGSQRSPGRRVDARSIGQRFRALAALSGPLRWRKKHPGLAYSARMLSHFGLADQISISYRQTVGNRSEAKRRCIENPPVFFRFPGVTFWEWLILLRKSGRLAHSETSHPLIYRGKMRKIPRLR